MSLPALPADPGRWCETAGTVVRVGGRYLLELPYAAPVQRSRGRQYDVAVAGQAPGRGLVLSVGGRAAVPAPPGCEPGAELPVRLRALPPPRDRRESRELAARLAEHGASLDELPAHEANQLVLMINEAADPAVRAGRVEAAVQAVLTRRRGAR